MQGNTLVEWSGAGVRQIKRAKGDVLMCQARPTTDCVVRVPANLAADPDSATLPNHREAGSRRRAGRPRRHRDRHCPVAPVTFDAGQFVVLEYQVCRAGAPIRW